jgi:inosose dehydratase
VGTWIETEQEVRYALAEAGSVGFGPDTGHLAWAGCDILGLLRDTLPRVGAVHIKDANLAAIREAATADSNLFQHVLAGAWQEPGRGDVPLLDVVALLRPTFSGWWVIEVDRAGLANPQESAAWCAAWAQQHLSTGATT